MAHPLDGARLKVVRAEEHLREVLRIVCTIKHGYCDLVTEEDKDSGCLVQRVRISTKAPADLSPIIGDFLFCLRSALDHIVCQLVLGNGKLPDTRTMFTIRSTSKGFAQAAVNQLRDVSPSAYAVIEGLQSYRTGDKTLERLNSLHNTDKHRTLNIVTVVADSANLILSRDGDTLLRMMIGDTELADGAVFGGIGVSMSNPVFDAEFPGAVDIFRKIKMEGTASLFVAFDDSVFASPREGRLDEVLPRMLEFVRGRVFPAFSAFFV